MKKKLVAIMMATAMVCAGSLAVSAIAEDVETEDVEFDEEDGEEEDEDLVILDWEEMEEEMNSSEELKAAWAGKFVDFEEIALKIYIPDSFKEVELSDEDIEAGYIGYYELRDEAALAVQYVDVDEMSLEEYKEVLADELDIEAYDAEVNGLPALTYTFEEDDVETTVLSFATEKGYIFEVSFAPTNDEEFAAVACVLMASVQEA